MLLLSSTIAETAGLLPAKYLRRTPKKNWDVRENLFLHKKKNSQTNNLMNSEIDQGYQADQPSQGTDLALYNNEGSNE